MKTKISSLVVAAVLTFPALASAKVVVGLFTKEPPAVFETKIKPLFSQHGGSCCEIRNLTPYKPNGEVDQAAWGRAVEGVPSDVTFLFFDWNERSSDKNRELSEALNRQIASGRILVAAAGVPPNDEGTCPLNRTLMGQVLNSVIIGELAERDRLLAQCFYGPEMLSAIRPPRDLMGQGHAPLIFSARLASNWSKRKSTEWIPHLKNRKNKSKRIWPELEEFFPRQ